MDPTGMVSSSVFLSEDGEYAAQLNSKDLIVHLNPTSAGFKDVLIGKTKEPAPKFLKFSRPRDVTSQETSSGVSPPGRRLVHASDTRVFVWQLNPLQIHAEIESIEPGALNIDFGGDENEIIVFHAWNTRITVYGLDTGRSQVIKSPKFAHNNGFGYRPRTRQLAVLLKPDASDLLTIHDFRSYELINRAVLPTIDAQGLQWSPDGRWVAVWEAASAGTKVLIFTADGQLFRTYTGLPGTDISLDLGVRGVEWSPISPQSGVSEFLVVGKVDGTIEILRTKTFSCSTSLSHVFEIGQHSPRIWRERYATADVLEYVESSSSSAFSTMEESSGPPRGVSTIAFSANAALMVTVDQTRANIVWIWELNPAAMLVSALVHETAIRQVVWHPSKIELLITTVSNTGAAVRCWSPHRVPSIVRMPVVRSESGRYDARWVLSGQQDESRFWFGTPEDYVLGYLEEDGGALRFQAVHHINSRVSARPHVRRDRSPLEFRTWTRLFPCGCFVAQLSSVNQPHQTDKMAPARKKWSKGKVKDKAQHAVVLEKQTAERLNKDVQSYRLITVATLVDRLKINGSLARKALADLEEKGQIKKVVGHSKMNIYTRAVTAE
ncbi:WD40 domain protein [Aspergillus ambiguus]|uniref:WD40 domain protein n=1 Tax=Aspergillus ambiguus TaxID=176160 RepID=UPI003CCDFE6A